MRGISTRTTDTFITNGGTVVRYADIFEGILANVETYGKTGGSRLAGQSLEDPDRLASDESEADSRIRTTEAEDYIMSKIASLNDSYRSILALQLQGLRPSKMAEALGCTPGVAATTLCRARKALRRALGEQFLGEFGYAV